MIESSIPAARIQKRLKNVYVFSLIIGCLIGARQVSSFGIPASLETRRTTPTATFQESKLSSLRISSQCSALFSKPSDEENKDDEEKAWDEEESLLVMNVSPLPDVSFDDSFSRISQYIRSFPFAAILPVQPLQQLPTDDGGLELRFLRKKTHIKPGVDGGIRFFVHQHDDEKIEILVKRNSDGQSIPKMFAEKLVVQSFAKGMALGSDYENDNKDASDSIKVPVTRIESPTKDMVQIQSIFHKWI